MRILVCASEAPLAPLNGLRLQLRALCEQLARRHEVVVVAFRWPGQEGAPPPLVELHEVAPPLPGAASRARDRAVSLLRREPVEVPRLTGPMCRALETVLAEREFDVGHVTLGVLAGVSPSLRGLPAVIAPLDAWALNVAAAIELASGARRAWLQAQHALVTRYSTYAYRSYERVVLVTPEDARETERLDPSLRTETIPNGVDVDHFRPVGRRVPRDRRLLLFTGALDSPPNVGAATRLAVQILPRVREQMPGADLAIVGRAPRSEVRALARLPGVRVEADAPDLRPWLTRAGVFACATTSGTGIKNKLLEAMACAAPVVATSLACRGLEVRSGEQLLVADDDESFAGAAVRILSDEPLADRLGATARRHVVDRHSWALVTRRYEAMYEEVIAAGDPASSRMASAATVNSRSN